MTDYSARPILAVSAAVFRGGRALIIRRARPPLLGHFSLPGGGGEVGERSPPHSPGNSWKKLASRPRSPPSTGMWRRLSPKATGSGPFHHCLIRHPLDEGRAARERRSRRRRLDRSGRQPTVADDARAWRNSFERGADRSSPRLRPARRCGPPK